MNRLKVVLKNLNDNKTDRINDLPLKSKNKKEKEKNVESEDDILKNRSDLDEQNEENITDGYIGESKSKYKIKKISEAKISRYLYLRYRFLRFTLLHDDAFKKVQIFRKSSRLSSLRKKGELMLNSNDNESETNDTIAPVDYYRLLSVNDKGNRILIHATGNFKWDFKRTIMAFQNNEEYWNCRNYPKCKASLKVNIDSLKIDRIQEHSLACKPMA